MEDYKQLIQETLAWVNSVRDKDDLPPLTELRPGNGHSAWSCPLATSLSEPDVTTYSVTTTDYTQWPCPEPWDIDEMVSSRVVRPLPSTAQRFVQLYDADKISLATPFDQEAS